MALEEFVADWLRRGTGVLYSHIFLPSLKDKALATFILMDFGNIDRHRCLESTGMDILRQIGSGGALASYIPPIFLPSVKDKTLANFIRTDFGRNDGHRCPDLIGMDLFVAGWFKRGAHVPYSLRFSLR